MLVANPAVELITITPSTGALNLVGKLTGQAASTKGAGSITPQSGELLLQGQQSIVRQQIRITPNAGALSLTGQTPAVCRSPPVEFFDANAARK